MTELTTAQRLATYRAELIAAGFDMPQVLEMLYTAAPTGLDDITLQADIDCDTPPIGEIKFRVIPDDLEGDVDRIMERLRAHNSDQPAPIEPPAG